MNKIELDQAYQKGYEDGKQAASKEKAPLECPRETCRWYREGRYQKCSCCARNTKNLKDCYMYDETSAAVKVDNQEDHHVSSEEEDDRVCRYNTGVVCDYPPYMCLTCGWNPEVEKTRKKKFLRSVRTP